MPVTIISKDHLKMVTPQATWALNMLPVVGLVNSNEPASKNASPWPVFDIQQMQTAPLVRLMNATHMYQPVSGSSKDSRYFMVAASPHIKMAARYRNNQLSLRLEGDLTKHKTFKSFSDFEIKSDAHASLHMSIADTELAAKALGAVMLDLDILFETPIPNFQIIKAAS